ncbi:Phosphoglycerate mutase-like protein AT74 [Glycine max]|nr:Phosphoglycerate mutase-like protein AT74 [Glycine max]
MQREENIRLSQENWDTTTYTTTPDHNIQSTVQGKTQTLRAGKHLHRVIGSDDCSPDWRMQFYTSP